jgi:hypothetical protein
MPVYKQDLNGKETWEAETIQRFTADGGTIAVQPGRYTLVALAVASADTALPLPTQADNGKIVCIWSEFAHAHVITTPATGINGALHLGTFGAALGNSFTLVARNASWWVIANVGVVLS